MADLTPLQEAFVNIMARTDILPMTAAREAGYACPDEASRDLMSNSHITGAIMKRKNRELATWRELGAKGRKTLDECMAKTYEVEVSDPNGEPIRCAQCEGVVTRIVAVKQSTRLNAAKAVFTVLAKASPETIAVKADKEDKAETLGEVAQRILGSPKVETVN